MATDFNTETDNRLIEHILSPWWYARAGAVERITIHHSAAAHVTARQIAEQFTGNRRASANYCIGGAGDLCVSVPENKVALTSSSYDNDRRAITIECGNSDTGPYWPVSPATFDTLLDLCVDICRRYGKKRLLWMDKNTALSYRPSETEMLLTVHNWFSPTVCPGPYLMEHMHEIAATVTSRINKGGTSMNRYSALDEIPEWAKPVVKRLLEHGTLEGTNSGLDISTDMLRLLVILDREGVLPHG